MFANVFPVPVPGYGPGKGAIIPSAEWQVKLMVDDLHATTGGTPR